MRTVEAPKTFTPRETDCRDIGSAEPVQAWRRPMSASLSGTDDVELLGVSGDGMPGRNVQRKPGTSRGLLRRSRTAKAPHINRCAAKLRCARERGGWGRLSDDGPGQHNLDRSEDPWSRATDVARMAVLHRAGVSDSVRGVHAAAESTKDGGKLVPSDGYDGSNLNRRAIREGPV